MTMLFEYNGSLAQHFTWMNFSCYAGDMHGSPIMFLNDYLPYCNFACTTHVMEFTEECLSGFWTYVHALLIIYFWLPGTWAKMTRSRWSYMQTFTFSKWHLTKRAGNMCHHLYISWYDTVFSKNFQLFNITNFNNNHQFTEM